MACNFLMGHHFAGPLHSHKIRLEMILSFTFSILYNLFPLKQKPTKP